MAVLNSGISFLSRPEDATSASKATTGLLNGLLQSQSPQPSVQMITSTKDIPEGMLISGDDGTLPLSSERRDDFALIAQSNNVVAIMVSAEAMGKPSMFDIRARVTNAGYQSIIKVASREIVRLCYEKIRSSAIDLQTDATDIEKLFGKIINDAASRKASDIHIETRGESADIFFRINGIRNFYANITTRTALSIGSVLYSVHADAGSKDVTWNHQEVKDGGVEWTLRDGQHLQLRFSSSPIYPSGNFHIVIRVLFNEDRVIKLPDLGYLPTQVNMLDVMSSGSNGIVLLCGPTGSGKSTTLQSMIGRVYERRGREIKIITVEDPVEYTIPGACQIPVSRDRSQALNSPGGSAFTTFLRGTLRQDPDVVMVGEIRDLESVLVTRDLVLAGRKVFATLHTYSALWAFVRLREIGLPWEVLTMPGFVSGIVYQRLLPVICPNCGIPITKAHDMLTQDQLHRLQHVVDLVDSNIRLRGSGCASCNNTGVTGRTVVAEYVIPDRPMLQMLVSNQFMAAEKYWEKTSVNYSEGDIYGGRPATVLQDAIYKMRIGLVSPIDVENQIGLLTSDLITDDTVVSNDVMRFGHGDGL